MSALILIVLSAALSNGGIGAPLSQFVGYIKPPVTATEPSTPAVTEPSTTDESAAGSGQEESGPSETGGADTAGGAQAPDTAASTPTDAGQPGPQGNQAPGGQTVTGEAAPDDGSSNGAPPAGTAQGPDRKPPGVTQETGGDAAGANGAGATVGASIAGRGSASRFVPARPPDGIEAVYPAVARERGYEGKVVLDVTVDETGKVQSVRVVVSSGHGLLDTAAETALQSTPFDPALRDGRATQSVRRISVSFQLVDSGQSD